MLSRISKFPRARATALAVGAGVLASLAFSSTAGAAPVPVGPLAGANCQSSGKISGRGSTLQLWLQMDLIGSYANDVCGGGVAADTAPPSGTLQVATDPTDPANPVASGTASTTQQSNWMVAYNDALAVAASATGSSNGKTSISCRTDAFGGTDIPYAKQDITNIDGTPGAEQSFTGKVCQPVKNGNTYAPPFQAGPFPSTDASGASVMSFPIGGSAVAFPINLSAADCGGTKPTAITLSIQDLNDIMGGVESNWSNLDTNHTVSINGATVAVNDAGENPQLASCTPAITRVVRNDTSGTTQAVLNTIADATGSSSSTALETCNASGTGPNGALDTHSWFQLDQNVIGSSTAQGNNNAWPGQNWMTGNVDGPPPSGCTQVDEGGSSGGPALLTKLEATDGGIGYVDVSDALNDGNSTSLIIPNLENSTSPSLPGLGYASNMTSVAPKVGTGSNCSFANASLPGSVAGNVGLDAGGDWALDFSSPNFDDVSWAHQGGQYAACTLTWDFVFSKENGNLTARSTGTQTLSPTSTSQTFNVVTMPAGTPTSGTFAVRGSTGQLQTLTYTGISGNSFTGVTGGNGTVNTAQIVTIAVGTGGPEGTLTANQRRTLYTYFSYVFTDPAQATMTSVGYSQLPESWISALRQSFQTEF